MLRAHTAQLSGRRLLHMFSSVLTLSLVVALLASRDGMRNTPRHGIVCGECMLAVMHVDGMKRVRSGDPEPAATTLASSRFAHQVPTKEVPLQPLKVPR